MTNWKFILSICLGLLIVYLAFDFFKPVINDNRETKNKIDSLNILIQKIQENQIRLDSSINLFNEQMILIDSGVKNIKGQKTIIKEIYHEKINNVNSYDSKQIDSFFSDRYR